mmetsp:Transcript_18529/g.25766  ORF Transcript_18529/g.25766 Transcript_18529/m.25766 type:complete len:82 (-) Transcript_18529:611-856(-)
MDMRRALPIAGLLCFALMLLGYSASSSAKSLQLSTVAGRSVAMPSRVSFNRKAHCRNYLARQPTLEVNHINDRSTQQKVIF